MTKERLGEALDESPKPSNEIDRAINGAQNLRARAVRGAAASGVAQAVSIILRTVAMVVLARLLFPRDFGVIGMATTVLGFLSMFRDFGLSAATMTQESVTHEQLSTLFWVNLVIGIVLAVICTAVAPILVAFYSEPRLLAVIVTLAPMFVFNGLAAQHRALLQRQLRFAALATIDTVTMLIAVIAAITLAAWHFGYWALVVMTLVPHVGGALGVWIAAGWMPALPKRRADVRPMLWYGGTITINGLVMYFAYSMDKVLVGRFWGAEALGLYSKACQLISLPTDTLNSSVAQVALPTLARLQTDRPRLRTSFLQAYGLVLAAVIPVAISCALFAEDVVLLMLGPRWVDAAGTFRLLAPTMIVLAVINPFGWLMASTGYSVRSLWIAVFITPCVVLGYVVGLPNGPQGVAFAFSVTMLLMATPVVVWAKSGTPITSRDIASRLMPPLIAAFTGAVVSIAVRGHFVRIHSTFWRLLAENGLLFLIYLFLLLFVLNQRATYAAVLRDFRFWPSRTVPKCAAVA